MRRAFATAALAAALLGGAGVAAADPDYGSQSTSWNGLSTLVGLAQGQGIEVVAATDTDWNELGKDDVLFLIYPTQVISANSVAAFLRNGGRVLLADDFGQADAALSKLGIIRSDAIGISPAGYYDDLPFAPIALPRAGGHPLAEHVDQLVTNHPSVFTEVAGQPDVVFGFGEGEAVVVAGALQEGRFVALADPSILINRMLEFPGNGQFALNLLRFLAPAEHTRRIVLIVGDARLTGEPTRLLGQRKAGLPGLLEDFNRWLDGLNDWLLTPERLHLVGVVLALLMAGLGLGLLPGRRRQTLDGSWTRAAAGGAAPPHLERLIEQLELHPRRASFVVPAAIVRDSVNAELGGVLELADPLYTLSPVELGRALEARRGRAVATAFARVQPLLAGLPTRAQAASPWEAGYVSRRDFDRLHAAVLELYRSLGT